jgi:hypothetical protein
MSPSLVRLGRAPAVALFGCAHASESPSKTRPFHVRRCRRGAAICFSELLALYVAFFQNPTDVIYGTRESVPACSLLLLLYICS